MDSLFAYWSRMVKREQLGTAKITEKNRIYIPPNVIEKLNLKNGDYLSFELDENDCICVFKGHLRFLRKANKCIPSGEK